MEDLGRPILFRPSEKDVPALQKLADNHPHLLTRADLLRYALHVAAASDGTDTLQPANGQRIPRSAEEIEALRRRLTE